MKSKARQNYNYACCFYYAFEKGDRLDKRIIIIRSRCPHHCGVWKALVQVWLGIQYVVRFVGRVVQYLPSHLMLR